MSAQILLPWILLPWILLALTLALGLRARARARARAAPPPLPPPPGTTDRSLFDSPAREGDNRLFALCEIDRFEAIRKHIGRTAASRVVRQVADAIRAGFPAAQFGRLSRTGIEFAWIEAEGADADRDMAELLRRLPTSFELEGCALDLRPRIAYLRVTGGATPEETVDLIEAALADPARQSQDLIPVEPPSDALAHDRLFLLKELAAAIAGETLDVHYQPKLDCQERRVTSVEALLRWHHPELGPISPTRIIQVAEETGLIRRLTFWVLTRVVEDQQRLAAEGLALPIYVNISGALLPDEGFAATAIEMVRGLEALIGFEITETAVIEDPERAIANLNSFCAAGLSIAIDDYGTGLSSLAYLKRLPARELKIDRLFISGLTGTDRDPLLVRSSIDLAHALDMKVTAEGVDNPLALSLLTMMGCDMVQGFLIAPALPLAELAAFLRRDSHVAHIRTIPGERP